MSTKVMAPAAGLGVQTAEFHLEELRLSGFIEYGEFIFDDGDARATWEIKHEGRAYLLKRGLLDPRLKN